MTRKGLLAAGIVALIIFGILALARGIGRFPAYHHNVQQIENSISDWETPPPNFEPQRWKATWELLSIAVSNVCFSEEACSAEEVELLYIEIHERSVQDHQLADLCWLWERLSRTGSHGRSYIKQMTPLWRETYGGDCRSHPTGQVSLMNNLRDAPE